METQNKKPWRGFAHLVNAAVSSFVEQTFDCMVRFLCCFNWCVHKYYGHTIVSFFPFLFQCQGEVAFYGIKAVKIYAREIVASSGSKIIVSTPNWNLEFSNAVATKSSGDGTDGQDGKDGKDGPQGQYYKTIVTCCWPSCKYRQKYSKICV